MIRARAPLRISFLGGGTDLPHYYEEHGGAVLSSTITRYACTTLYPRSDDSIQITRDRHSATYKLNDHSEKDGIFDLVTTAIRRMGGHKGLDLDLRSQAPRGSGLGGSSAVTAAILGAMAEYLGVVLDPYDLAELNYTVERLDLGIAGGKQDQYATTFGGFNLIEFSRDRVNVTPLRLSSDAPARSGRAPDALVHGQGPACAWHRRKTSRSLQTRRRLRSKTKCGGCIRWSMKRRKSF